MRTWLRSKISLLFMTLGLLVAIPAVAFAADLVSDVNADLSSSVSTPTWVGANADKTFQIKVWAVGNYNNINTPDRTGAVEVVKNYETFLNTTWQTRPGSSGNGTVLATDKETINFEQGLTDAGYSLSSLSNSEQLQLH
jgi:hypothetical protein